MNKKIKIKEFLNLKKCETFMDNFCKNNNVLVKKFIPISTANPYKIIYFVFLEYYK
jgi:hypothetical protein